jgi:hypothetical protein
MKSPGRNRPGRPVHTRLVADSRAGVPLVLRHEDIGSRAACAKVSALDRGSFGPGPGGQRLAANGASRDVDVPTDPSAPVVLRCLPAPADAIAALVVLVAERGGDMVTIKPNGKTSVPIETATVNVGRIAEIAVALAGA